MAFYPLDHALNGPNIELVGSAAMPKAFRRRRQHHAGVFRAERAMFENDLLEAIQMIAVIALDRRLPGCKRRLDHL